MQPKPNVAIWKTLASKMAQLRSLSGHQSKPSKDTNQPLRKNCVSGFCFRILGVYGQAYIQDVNLEIQNLLIRTQLVSLRETFKMKNLSL